METVSSNEDDVVELSESLITRVYYAAKDGMAIALYDLLSNKPIEQVNELINQRVYEEDGQQCTLLITAARNGHDKVVKILLDKFKPDLEQEGTVKFDGCVVEKASALWCAAAAGHLPVVKSLVKAGADVNHPTGSQSTPLTTACSDGRLDIVKYLAEHNANINISNHVNNTCLMIAALKGHAEVVRYLLKKGADPNEKADCGATALHLAAESGHTIIVAQLLVYGARMSVDARGMTPLIVAAERMRADVVEWFIRKAEVSKEETIEAYELLGASYGSSVYVSNDSLVEAYKYFWKAMELRFSDPKNIIYKKLGEPVKAYDNWRECETLENLKSVMNNQNAFHMESLAIRERILGPHNPRVPNQIIFRGAVFGDQGKHDRCIDLWLHALYLKQLNNVTVVKDLLRFARVFSQMIHAGVDIDFSQVLSVLEAFVTELSRNKSKINYPVSEEDVEYIREMESNIKSTLYILQILTKLLTMDGSRYAERDKDKAHCLVHKLCVLQLNLEDGQTLLHLAVNETPVKDSVVCKFPCAATAKLLVRCGADVNAMDNERNTPLHVIVGCIKTISDFETLYTIIMELIEAGAHMDTINSRGQTPYYAAITGEVESILRTQTKLSLKCIAARAVKTYNLSYCERVPRSLESFIELHGPGLN
ncbi:protein fem-1 homolog B [Hylaeus volcanicus]|uniref:protein fem-1 homolog B n=1 Tax=Hylaeus volcanicus TaxID=313075 RepID=UPI0023B867E7|nr:protein fem-1 homolog B [Hylaeus volcanicus]XP_053983871.1 protein fem-1 homolog B [Hylaeus volcanicus]XP_053983873.1 protein fem-1 homolog B [Hylaeus volcanicus]XP_053983874.1 protein fem-1 homolog B [Hylaeus volcanicus]XP_053983875.1 protein fem-1 homolog B [Hylaeus volcanicus]XP_053983876.1 protein fem-1 homolog B [Hylaeus volcanicus]